MNDFELRIPTKEEYSGLIEELRENSEICLHQFQRYKKMLEVMPGAYNDSAEDYAIYKQCLSKIKLDELLENQYIDVVNISNRFDETYATIKRDTIEIAKINLKYNNRRCVDRQFEISDYNRVVIEGPNLNRPIPSVCVVGSLPIR